jgi:hypothetical protein
MSDFNNGAMLGAINAKLDQMIREMREMRRAMDKSHIPRSDAWIKGFLSIAAPCATLWATGSVSKALEVLALVAGR